MEPGGNTSPTTTPARTPAEPLAAAEVLGTDALAQVRKDLLRQPIANFGDVPGLLISWESGESGQTIASVKMVQLPNGSVSMSGTDNGSSFEITDPPVPPAPGLPTNEGLTFRPLPADPSLESKPQVGADAVAELCRVVGGFFSAEPAQGDQTAEARILRLHQAASESVRESDRTLRSRVEKLRDAIYGIMPAPKETIELPDGTKQTVIPMLRIAIGRSPDMAPDAELRVGEDGINIVVKRLGEGARRIEFHTSLQFGEGAGKESREPQVTYTEAPLKPDSSWAEPDVSLSGEVALPHAIPLIRAVFAGNAAQSAISLAAVSI